MALCLFLGSGGAEGVLFSHELTHTHLRLSHYLSVYLLLSLPRYVGR